MFSRFVSFAYLDRGVRPNPYDFAAFILLLSAFVALAYGSRGLTLPLSAPEATAITLDYTALPYYALRTTLRMFAAMGASLVFTFIYATLAAKSRRAELVLIPLLDILQSVPILGFLSFTVTFFLQLFPGSMLGAECAAVFAIFTSQAWNMAFSFYQSLRNLPRDLVEVSNGFHLSPWQKFWQLETPFAMPSLIWNMMMSMSGGWFFVVASEAISVGNTTIKLPGIGSYLAQAIEMRRIDAIVAAVATMAIVILLYDQFLFRPLVVFGGKFRVELSASQTKEHSWVADLFSRTRWLSAIMTVPVEFLSSLALLRLEPGFLRPKATDKHEHPSRVLDLLWISVLALCSLLALRYVVAFIGNNLTFDDIRESVILTCFTMIRVIVLMVLATIVWVPVGVYIGLRPALAEKVQPLTQFLAAFPANVVFPIAVVLIVRYQLNPDIWLSFLIIFGTQWYILFNVIAGTTAFPNDLKEAARAFGIKGWHWWISVILPGIFPYYVTGALTASGGSWNAAIVAEYVKWGDVTIAAHGIGAYISEATVAGDYPRIVLGVGVMAIFVILFNRLLWRPLFGLAERRLRLD